MKWIDLTDMLVWSGHFTGIQRVTYEYARRFHREGAKFFAYDAIDGRLIEVPFSLVEQYDEMGAKVEPQRPLSRITLKKRMRTVIGTPYYKLSPQKQAALRPYVEATNHTVRSVLHQVSKRSNKLHHVRASPYASYPTAEMNKGDTAVLIGASWNDSSVLDALIESKQSLGITISQHMNDILPIYQPQLFSDELPGLFTPYVTKALRNADIVTVISEATRRDIVTFCEDHDIALPRIEVVRLGDNPQTDITAKRPAAFRSNEEFVLAVGTFEVRKNYLLLYQAVKLAQIEEKELPTIVIAGRKGWLTEDVRHMISLDPHAKEKIIWLNDVSDGELKWLFQNCMFTVFPSIAEGWGLPIVESLQNGKFCLSSGTSSMLEIGDGLVDYFLPYDARECLAKLEYYTTDERYIAANNEVLNKYSVFTWDESYDKLSSVLGRS